MDRTLGANALRVYITEVKKGGWVKTLMVRGEGGRGGGGLRRWSACRLLLSKGVAKVSTDGRTGRHERGHKKLTRVVE